MTRFERRILDALQSQRGRELFVRSGIWGLLGSAVAWPAMALTVARHEPQTVLGLSFLAITYTAWGVLLTAEIHRENQEDKED